MTKDTKKDTKKADTKAGSPESHDFQNYAVGFDGSNRDVDIYLKDQLPQGHLRLVGEFSADPINGVIKDEDDFDPKGDGILVAKARALIEELGVSDTKGFTFRDRAGNVPLGSSYVLTHDEREKAIKDGESPADVQQEIAQNIEEVDAKLDPKEGTSKKK